MNTPAPIRSLVHHAVHATAWLGLVMLLTACDPQAPAGPGPAAAPAQPASAAPPALTQQQMTDLEAQYKGCAQGYYTGPRPGRVRYTKDEYLWAVTPEFAAAYCMPPEFIDPQLKGAAAIAYKPVFEGYESCGFGGNKEACGRRMAHGIDIYFKSSQRIESLSDTKYNYRAFYMLPSSKHLLQQHLPHDIVTPRRAWEAQRPGAQARFHHSKWGIDGVKGFKTVWPIAAFGEVQYIEEVMPGYHYLSLEGSVGGFNNPRMQKLGVSQFVLGLEAQASFKKQDEDMDIRTDYAHVIELPGAMVNAIRQVDAQGAQAFDALVRPALPPPR